MKSLRAILTGACAAAVLSACASLGSVDTMSLINIAAKSG